MVKRMLRMLPVPAAVAVSLVFLFPLLWMVAASLLPDDRVLHAFVRPELLDPAVMGFSNYADVFRRVPFVRIILTSLAFTGTVTVAGLFINSACGYAFARLEVPGGTWAFMAVTALLIIPFEALALPLFLVVGAKWKLMNTVPGLFLPYLAKAFNIFFMRQYFLSLPRGLEEAARVEGASWFRVFFTVALPLAKPALATCAVLDFTTHWSEYLWPLLMTNIPAAETVQTGLGHFYTLPPVQWGDIMAYSVMATLPMAAVFAFFQRYLVMNAATAGMKG